MAGTGIRTKQTQNLLLVKVNAKTASSKEKFTI